MYNELLGKLHFCVILHRREHDLLPACTSSGLDGMPRRIPDYTRRFADWNEIVDASAT